MAEPLFTRDAIQIVSDWQRGGNHHQKILRGQRLKELSGGLPKRFREFDAICFRQEAHEKDRTWQLLACRRLPEEIAAWTTDLDVARNFKGGVPPPGFNGVIFSVKPPPDAVIINLNALFADPEFRAAVEVHRSKVIGFADGTGRWGISQMEVVLEFDRVEPARVVSYGGFSADRKTLAALNFGREPTSADLTAFDALMTEAGIEPGQWWLSTKGTRAVLQRIEPHIQRLKEQKKASQTSSKFSLT